MDKLLLLLLIVFSIFTTGHVLLNKRDPRAALVWIILCLAIPGVGALFYWLLGINRVRNRARGWQQDGHGMYWHEESLQDCKECELNSVSQQLALPLLRLSDSVTRKPLVDGNSVDPLVNGDKAYPAMLEAIRKAESLVYLSTYIFDSGAIGNQFATALKAAAERGVDVRVLVDALGERYSVPTARRLFRDSKVRYIRFLPPSLTGQGIHLHLRNHRKILVIDGTIAFTGGMNISARHLLRGRHLRKTKDIHFSVHGPVVAQIQETFLEDWYFATREPFEQVSEPPQEVSGSAMCRGISAGPNEEYETLSWLYVGALNAANHSVRIMTPYFVPDRPLISAINAASLRGVQVEIVLPAKNNLPFVGWASWAFMWEMLQHGTRIFLDPPPFNHSKLLLVDDYYILLGSSNMDPRSMRLNFEFNLEVVDPVLSESLTSYFDQIRKHSKELSLQDVDSRSLAVKLRDAFCKLFTPYL